MTKPLKPSTALKPNYSPSKDRNSGVWNFDLKKRAPSVLCLAQGDHVTAYSLLEEGLYKKLDELTIDERENLSDIGNRDLLRTRRSELFDYVSSIAVLDLERKESLYLALDQVLVSVVLKNRDKIPKNVMKEIDDSFSSLSSSEDDQPAKLTKNRRSEARGGRG
jgi:hypothetical protein